MECESTNQAKGDRKRCVAKIAAVLTALLLALGALAWADIVLGIMIIWAVAYYSS